MSNALEAIATLRRCKVPMAIRTRYEDGKPVSSAWMMNTVTKKDRFFRINGKIVSRNIAAYAIRAGVAEMAV